MDYSKIYSDAFSLQSYSAEHHTQYDFAVSCIATIHNKTNEFSCIDIGSGRGQLLRLIRMNYPNVKLTSVDIQKFNDEKETFIRCDLSSHDDRLNLLDKKYDVLCCTDVFEHLDKTFIDDVINMCSLLSKKCILCIANHSDIINGVELHTIQENDIWWESHLDKHLIIEQKVVLYNGTLYTYLCTSK